MPSLASAGHATEAGSRYGELNQDYALVRPVFAPEEILETGTSSCTLAAVLDGHGMLGERVARAAGDALAADVARRARLNGRQLLLQPPDKLHGALAAAFEKAHQTSLAVYDDPPSSITYPCSNSTNTRFTLYRPSGIPCYRPDASRIGPAGDRLLECGTTCTLAVVQGDQLCVANVGDSAAALISLTDDGDVAARMLTTDHNGHNAGEVGRITTKHGHMARISDDRGYLSICAGMWAGYELSVTRALGHKHLEAYGVSCEPSVTSHRLRDSDACLILASDGVWEVMDAREAGNRVMDVLSSGGSADEAARQLVADSVMLADCSPGADVDNTTAVVLVFG